MSAAARRTAFPDARATGTGRGARGAHRALDADDERPAGDVQVVGGQGPPGDVVGVGRQGRQTGHDVGGLLGIRDRSGRRVVRSHRDRRGRPVPAVAIDDVDVRRGQLDVFGEAEHQNIWCLLQNRTVSRCAAGEVGVRARRPGNGQRAEQAHQHRERQVYPEPAHQSPHRYVLQVLLTRLDGYRVAALDRALVVEG